MGSSRPGELLRRDCGAQHLCERQTSVRIPPQARSGQRQPRSPPRQSCLLPQLPALRPLPALPFPKAGLKGETEPPTVLRSAAGLASRVTRAPKRHPCDGCWKQLFKIQQPLCLTTRSDLWYFLPKQFICLAQQLINSPGHPSRGCCEPGRQQGQMVAVLAGLIQC